MTKQCIEWYNEKVKKSATLFLLLELFESGITREKYNERYKKYEYTENHLAVRRMKKHNLIYEKDSMIGIDFKGERVVLSRILDVTLKELYVIAIMYCKIKKVKYYVQSYNEFYPTDPNLIREAYRNLIRKGMIERDEKLQRKMSLTNYKYLKNFDEILDHINEYRHLVS